MKELLNVNEIKALACVTDMSPKDYKDILGNTIVKHGDISECIKEFIVDRKMIENVDEYFDESVNQIYVIEYLVDMNYLDYIDSIKAVKGKIVNGFKGQKLKIAEPN